MDNKRYNRKRVFTSKTISYIVVVVFGVIVFFALQNIQTLIAGAEKLFGILSPFVSGAIIAFLLNIPARYLEKTVFSRFKARRPLAIASTYLLAIIALLLMFSLLLPQLVVSTRSLVSNVSLYIENLNGVVDWAVRQFDLEPASLGQALLSYEDLLNQFLHLMREMIPDIVGLSVRIGSGVVSALTAVISSAYMLASKDRLLKQSKRALYAVVPRKAADRTLHILSLASGVFSSFLSGKIIDSAIIGALCFIGMSIMSAFGIDMQFSPLISVVVGVTNVIPFFGPFIGAIPSIMILLMVNPMSAIWFTVFIIVLQQFDGNFLGPKILGDSTGLPALWVLVSIIVGGGLFGFAGMIAGVPIAAVIQTLARESVAASLRKRGLEGDDGELNLKVGEEGGSADADASDSAGDSVSGSADADANAAASDSANAAAGGSAGDSVSGSVDADADAAASGSAAAAVAASAGDSAGDIKRKKEGEGKNEDEKINGENNRN